MMRGYLTEFGGIRNGFFHRNVFFERDESFEAHVEGFIQEHGSTDVYYCVYSYESEDIANCKLIGSPYLDFDAAIGTEEAFEALKREVRMALNYFAIYWGIPTSMIEVYFSGSKGFHVVIPYEILGIEPDDALNLRNKALAQLVALQCKSEHIDMAIYDRRRLFRIPNTINGKSGLYKVPLTYGQLTKFSLADIIEWASEPRPLAAMPPKFLPKSAGHYQRMQLHAERTERRQKKAIQIPKERRKLLPCVVEILKTGVGQGQRNNTAVALASSLMQSGVGRDEAEDILLAWNEDNAPPLPSAEIARTVSSAFRGLTNGMGYGCAKFKELGYCIGRECRLAKK